MVTSQMQVEGEVSVDEAVKEILAEMEAEEQDPIEGMGNAQIAEIYHRMKPEDQRLFRQFKKFHKQYYETHGHDAPSHQLTRGIVRQMFLGLLSVDADTIAKARAELLAAERLKELCKQLGLAVPTQLQAYPPPPEAPEYPPPPQPPRFLSRQDKERMAAQQQLLAETEEAEVKPDIKPRRLATSYLGPPGLLRMIGSGDEDHIITRVVPGTDPMQDFEDDDPAQTIIIDHDTDASSDVDDLSEVSMASASGIGKQEFQGLLSDIAAQYQRMAASLDALASRVEDMSVEQVEEAAVRVASETGHVRGLEEITRVFDKGEVALILACGVHRYQEYQALKGKREDKDIISYRQLQKKFGTNKKNTDGGGTRLQVPISRRGINKSTICADQAGGGRGGSNYKRDSCDKRPHHNISPYGTNTKSQSFQDHQLLPKLKYTSEKLSVDTLVKLSKGNIDALLSAK